jgi:hypothetical protein
MFALTTGLGIDHEQTQALRTLHWGAIGVSRPPLLWEEVSCLALLLGFCLILSSIVRLEYLEHKMDGIQQRRQVDWASPLGTVRV